MKTVYLLRHAKSSWDEPYLSDHERPLSPRGQKAAPRMGKYMSREKLIPQVALCSTATRALETWDLAQGGMGVSVPTTYTKDIYLAAPQTILNLIQRLSDKQDSVIVIGHNPTFEDLASSLANTGEVGAMRELATKYPTGALAVLDFGVNRWNKVASGAGYLRKFVRPKSLKKG